MNVRQIVFVMIIVIVHIYNMMLTDEGEGYDDLDEEMRVASAISI